MEIGGGSVLGRIILQLEREREARIADLKSRRARSKSSADFAAAVETAEACNAPTVEQLASKKSSESKYDFATWGILSIPASDASSDCDTEMPELVDANSDSDSDEVAADSIPAKGTTHIAPDGDGRCGTCACRNCIHPVYPEDEGWCDLCFGNVGGICSCNCDGCGCSEAACEPKPSKWKAAPHAVRYYNHGRGRPGDAIKMSTRRPKPIAEQDRYVFKPDCSDCSDPWCGGPSCGRTDASRGDWLCTACANGTTNSMCMHEPAQCLAFECPMQCGASQRCLCPVVDGKLISELDLMECEQCEAAPANYQLHAIDIVAASNNVIATADPDPSSFGAKLDHDYKFGLSESPVQFLQREARAIAAAHANVEAGSEEPETGDCANCGEGTPRHCSMCENAWYCSRRCQEHDKVSHFYTTDGACGEDCEEYTPAQRENAKRRLGSGASGGAAGAITQAAGTAQGGASASVASAGGGGHDSDGDSSSSNSSDIGETSAAASESDDVQDAAMDTCEHVWNGQFTCNGQQERCPGLWFNCGACGYAKPVEHRLCTCIPQTRPSGLVGARRSVASEIDEMRRMAAMRYPAEPASVVGAVGHQIPIVPIQDAIANAVAANRRGQPAVPTGIPDSPISMYADQIVTGVSGDTVVVGTAHGSPQAHGSSGGQNDWRPGEREPGFTRYFKGNMACPRETGQPSHGVYGVPKVLILFSGPQAASSSAPDFSRTLAGALHALGFDTCEFDIVVDPRSDLLHYRVFNDLMWRIDQNEFRAVFAAPPCGTFSVARTPLDGSGGPTALRSREHPMGLPGLSRIAREQTTDANILLQRTARIVLAIDAYGGHWIIENPVDRGNPNTQHYREAWSRHCPIWVMETMEQMYIGTRQAPGSVDFAQCGLGGDYQKFTTLMYCAELTQKMQQFSPIACDHNSHRAVAFGQELDGTFRSARAAHYPPAMNMLLADILHAQITSGLRQLRPGNPDPHRQVWGENGGPSTSPCIVGYASSSQRTLTRESAAMLVQEALPKMNMVQRHTEWESPPVESRPLPEPLTTDQLIPMVVQDRLWRFRGKMKHSCEAAASGRWQWARGCRPDPVYVPAADAMLPAGEGWTWWRDVSTNMWHPVTASRYPESPPSTGLDLRAIVDYARASSFRDMQIIAWTANGFPGPRSLREGPKDVLFGALHVGAIKNYADYKRCADKDVAQGFALPGVSMPVIWPMRGAPTNCVRSRQGKARMTVDLTIQLKDGVTSYNDAVAADTELINTKIEMCTVRQLARATAILLTSGVRVRNWGFDLAAYFRQIGTQRMDWWLSGTTRAEGFGRDERVQFGMREAMELTGRHTNFLVFAVRTELNRLDLAYPPHINVLKQWRLERAHCVDSRRGCPHTQASWYDVNAQERHAFNDDYVPEAEWDRRHAMSAICMFVDDIAGASIDDELNSSERGGPWMARLESGEMAVHTRAKMHYEAALGVIMHFGHKASPGKESPPSMDLIFLGVRFEWEREMLTLARWKRDDYANTAREVLAMGTCKDRTAHAGAMIGEGAIIVPYQLLNSLVHRLLHAASVIVMGRQHLHYMRQATRVTNRLGGNRCLLWGRGQQELRWWIAKLMEDESVGLPYASRILFPTTDPAMTSDTLLISYSDASREFGRDFSESGWGGWCVLCGFFYYVEGRWTEDEVALLSINVLELLAMNIAVMTFVAEAHRLGLIIDDVCEFTDNVAAEMSADRGNPHAEGMHHLVLERYQFFERHNISSACTRVTSIDNDIADGLSRGGRFMADALRLAAASNIWMRRLEPTLSVRDDASERLIMDARATILLG